MTRHLALRPVLGSVHSSILAGMPISSLAAPVPRLLVKCRVALLLHPLLFISSGKETLNVKIKFIIISNNIQTAFRKACYHWQWILVGLSEKSWRKRHATVKAGKICESFLRWFTGTSYHCCFWSSIMWQVVNNRSAGVADEETGIPASIAGCACAKRRSRRQVPSHQRAQQCKSATAPVVRKLLFPTVHAKEKRRNTHFFHIWQN